MKIQVKEVGVAEDGICALDTHGNKLEVGEYEVELVWQWDYKPPAMQYGWRVANRSMYYTFEQFANGNFGLETRQAYICSIAPESKEVNDEDDGMFHCNGCGKAMEDEDIAFTNDDGYDYCTDCNEAIQGDPESAAGLIGEPAIDEAAKIDNTARNILYKIIPYDSEFAKVGYFKKLISAMNEYADLKVTAALSVNKQPEKEVDTIEQWANKKAKMQAPFKNLRERDIYIEALITGAEYNSAHTIQVIKNRIAELEGKLPTATISIPAQLDELKNMLILLKA